MDLQQLRYVVEVAETANFTRAAERCFVTQSALSHQIAALEREIGERLFARTSRSVRPTEAGEAFIRHARIALSAARSAGEDAAAAGGRVIGTLRLGIIPTVTAVNVPGLLIAYRSAHPESRVELRVGNSDSLIADVRRGDLDVALIGIRAGERPEGVASHEIARERLVAVLPASHRLRSRSRIRLEDLADEIFADFPAGTSGRAQSDVAFAAAGVRRDVAFESDTADLAVDLVAAGLAVTLLAPGVVSGRHEDVISVPVVDGPERVEYAVWQATAPRNVATAVLGQLREILQAVNATAAPEQSPGAAVRSDQ